MLGFNGEHATDNPEAKFWRPLVRKKTLHKKPILLNFMNLSTTLCPRL